MNLSEASIGSQWLMPLAAGAAAATLLLVAFAITVREGRLASPRARIAALGAIGAAALLAAAGVRSFLT